jgi:hypothetical protein
MRQARFSYSLVFTLLAACGGDSKPSNPDAPTGPPGDAAAIDTPSGGGMINITGSAVQRMPDGSTPPVSGATIGAYQNGNDTTPVATTTSAADGSFTLSVPASGGPLDGYLKATQADLKDTYLYAPAPISADTVAPVNMIAPGTLNLLVLLSIGAGQQDAAKGLIALVVVNGSSATSMPVAGAVVTSTSAGSAVRYNGSSGLPEQGADKTAADGTAFIFNVTPTVDVTVSATAPSLTLKSHPVRARADAFTTTLITP